MLGFSALPPPAAVVALMDRLVPATLFPLHPDGASRGMDAARTLLFVRSHWIRMPPTMLARHLVYKAWVRKFPRE